MSRLSVSAGSRRSQVNNANTSINKGTPQDKNKRQNLWTTRNSEADQSESYKAIWQALYDNSYVLLESALEKDCSAINSKGTGYLEGETPLIFSANTGRTSFARLLLRFGAELTWLDKHGKTALEIAQEKNHEDIITELTNYQKKLDALPVSSKQFAVEVISAEGLRAADSNGKSDPYCKISWDNLKKINKFKTNVVHKTLSPIWNFKFDLPPPDDKTTQLVFNVYDYDKIGRHEHLGRVTHPLNSIITLGPGPTTVNKTLLPKDPKKKEKKKLGTLNYKIIMSLKEKLKPQLHFGRALKESLNSSIEDKHQHLVDKAIEYLLRPDSLHSEGIIRIPGGKNEIYRLKDEIDDGRNVSFEGEDPFVVAGLLKLYFYELPDSVFPQHCFSKAQKSIPFEDTSLIQENVTALKSIIQEVSEPSLSILKKVIGYLIELSKYSSINKMDKRAISLSIGPTILIAPDIREDPALFMAATKVGPPLMQMMLNHAVELGLKDEPQVIVEQEKGQEPPSSEVVMPTEETTPNSECQ